MYNMTQEVDGNSHRFNSGKIVMSNLPPGILSECIKRYNDLPIIGFEKLGEHYTLATAKYSDADAENGYTFPNWAKGQLIEAFLIDSAYRHLYAWLGKEEIDEDFGSHHLVAVAWCDALSITILITMSYIKN